MENQTARLKRPTLIDPAEQRRPPTMADVARTVGVSRQLVGLAFRNEPGVGPATKRRILSAARKLGYSPNSAAQSLRRPSTKYIGVLFDPRQSSPSEIIKELYILAERRGYRLVLSATHPGRAEKDAINELVGYRCESLILIAPMLDAAELRAVADRIPTVVMGHKVTASGCDIVRSSGDAGIERIVAHLVSLGHEQIAYVHASDMLDSGIRLSGYLRGMTRHDLRPRIETLGENYTEESGAEAAKRFLEAGALPTAIVCSNDQAAMGLIVRMLQSGVRVPEDVSVTGFDDSHIARLSFMSLTTVRQDPTEMAAAAMTAALGHLTGERNIPTEFLTSSEVIIRETTAPPRSGPHPGFAMTATEARYATPKKQEHCQNKPLDVELARASL